MGWKHVRMREGDRFQDAVLALRAAEMIGDEALPFGVRSLSTEDGVDGWDDIVEVGEDETQGEWRCRAQVKSTELAISRDEMERLLGELASSPDHHRLVVAPWAEVHGIGRVAGLRALCDRCRSPNVSVPRLLSDLTGLERLWFDEVRRSQPGVDDAASVRALARMNVAHDGDREDVWRRTLAILARYFGDGTVARALLMEVLSEASTADASVTATWLLDRLEPKCPLRDVGQPRGARRVRQILVSQFADALRGVVPLDALDPGGVAWEAGVTLDAVAVPPSLAANGAARSVAEFIRESTLGAATGPSGVEGPVGCGKSSFLLALAQEFLQTDRAAVPLLARASTSGLAPVTRFHDVDVFAQVLRSPFLPKALLVDGLDEVDAASQRAVREELHRFSRRADVQVCVVAARPWAFQTWPAVRRYEIEPWTPEDIATFLDRWARFDASSVAAVRACTHAGDLLRWPFTATLLLRVARELPGTLPNRFELFAEVTALMFVDWAAARIGTRDDAGEWWHEGRGGFEALALRAWASPDGAVTAAEVRAALGGVVGDARARRAIEVSDRVIGLLVPLEAGRFRFAYRWVLEYLLGEHVFNTRGSAPSVPARTSEVEIARHAVSAAAMHMGTAVVEPAVEALLDSVALEPGTAGVGLPALLAAVRICTDAEKVPEALITTLAERVVERLVDETSVWVGDEVLKFIRETDVRSPLAVAIRGRLIDFASASVCTPAAWLRSNPPGELDDLIPWLMHRDAEVRAVAVDILPSCTVGEQLEGILLNMLHDAGSPMGVEVPAVRAARALRPLIRARQTGEPPMPYLSELLRSGGQLPTLAAAIAVPTGFEPAMRIRAMQGAHNLFGSVRDLLDELAASPKLGPLLDTAWPNWRDGGYTPFPPAVCETEVTAVPLSPGARLRVLRALAPASDEQPALFSGLLAKPNLEFHEVLAICDAGQRVPDLIVRLLARPVQPWTIFPDDAADLIGIAASRRVEVRDALLERWERERVASVKVFGSYPGDALIPLVLTGDSEAEDAYAEWLPRSYLGGFVQRARPDGGAGSRPRVERVARKAALDLWEWGKPHLNAKGETEQGHPNTVGGGLRHWWPAWLDTPIVEGLWAWLEGTHAERAGAAADALLAGTLPEPWASRLPSALTGLVQRLMGSDDFIERGVLRSVMKELVGSPVVLGMVDAVRGVADTSAGELHLVAAAALLPHVHEEEARTLSASASRAWPPEFFLRGRVQDLLAPLVEANPHAWGERAADLARDAGLYAASDIEQLMGVAPRAIAPRLETVIEDLERTSPMIPWISRSDRRIDVARPADIVQRLRYLHGRSSMLPREG